MSYGAWITHHDDYFLALHALIIKEVCFQLVHTVMNPQDERKWSRRDVLRTMALSGLALGTAPTILRQDPEMMTRPIPSSGEELPVVGLGTWQSFDVGASAADRDPRREVLRRFVGSGGTVIDSSPMYGRSEAVVGDLTSELGIQDSLFFATKVWTEGLREGKAQMNESFRLMKVDRMDLMQVHNLVDWETHLPTLREWKAEGRLRYVGVTHYQVRSYPRLEELIKTQDLDFVQFNFSMMTRASEGRLLPLAAEYGVATLINRPYEGGSLFRKVSGKDLPSWASEFECESWGQFFLKYLLSNPHVTCVIPGTGDPIHIADNTRAGYGRLPDEETRRRMVAHIESL